MYKESTTAWCIAVLFLTAIGVVVADGDNGETGVLKLTKDQFNNLVYGESDSLQVSKEAAHEYSALKTIPVVGNPQPVTKDKCWQLYYQFYASHLATYQAWANKYCLRYIGCWCCPNGGLCVTFCVFPTALCPIIANPVYAQKIRVFEPYLETTRS